MSSFKIFQIERGPEDIRKIILTNIIKMFTERKLLDQEKLEENIKSITEKKPDENLYNIHIDNKDIPDKTFIVKIFDQRIISISKQSPINEFLLKHKNTPKLIVVKDINTKSAQFIVASYPKTELFLEHELLIDLIDSDIVDKYEPLDRNSDQYKTFHEDYASKKRRDPFLFVTDPMAKYYNLKKGDIVRIIRASETSGESASYRLVI
jgi:DNA-directed RNA polymerase subunit H (RpoH/RPB5)